MSHTRRETVIETRESGVVAAVSPIAVITELEAVRLDDFEELIIYWQVTAGMVGSTPQLRLTLQRALVRDADPAIDAHWDALLKFNAITTAPAEQVALLPRVPTQPAVVGVDTWTRTDEGLSNTQVVIGRFYDRLRVLEQVTGSAITQPATYSLHLTGALR